MARSVQVSYTCDVCGKAITEEDAYSFIVHFAKAGKGITTSILCPDEQHYGCSPEHARQAAIDCIDKHLEPKRQQLAG